MKIEEYCEKYLSQRLRPIQRIQRDIDLKEAGDALLAIGRHLTPDFVIDKDNRKAYTDVLKWCIGKEGSLDLLKGIYLWGDTGTGKTLMLSLMLNISRYYGIGFRTATGEYPLIDKTARADEICDDYAEEGDLTKWVAYPSLCINDLGAEPDETLYMGNRRKVLRSIIEQRADRADRMTLITSNYPPDAEEIVQIYGYRVMSRIKQMCNVICLPGQDRRK